LGGGFECSGEVGLGAQEGEFAVIDGARAAFLVDWRRGLSISLAGRSGLSGLCSPCWHSSILASRLTINSRSPMHPLLLSFLSHCPPRFRKLVPGQLDVTFSDLVGRNWPTSAATCIVSVALCRLMPQIKANAIWMHET